MPALESLPGALLYCSLVCLGTGQLTRACALHTLPHSPCALSPWPPAFVFAYCPWQGRRQLGRLRRVNECMRRGASSARQACQQLLTQHVCVVLCELLGGSWQPQSLAGAVVSAATLGTTPRYSVLSKRTATLAGRLHARRIRIESQTRAADQCAQLSSGAGTLALRNVTRGSSLQQRFASAALDGDATGPRTISAIWTGAKFKRRECCS